MASVKQVIPLADGGAALKTFLAQYRAEFVEESSTDKGHVYWSAPVVMWILVMRKGKNAHVTFHDKDNCPCSKL